MSFRDLHCPASLMSVRYVIDGLEVGEETVTQVPTDNHAKLRKFRMGLSTLAPGKYTTTTQKGDGYLWVKRLR